MDGLSRKRRNATTIKRKLLTMLLVCRRSTRRSPRAPGRPHTTPLYAGGSIPALQAPVLFRSRLSVLLSAACLWCV